MPPAARAARTVYMALRPGDVLPARQLPTLSGGPTRSLGPGAQRAQVVVVTHPEPCPACLSYLTSFEALQGRFDDEKADVVAVLGPQWRQAPDFVTALIDDGTVATAFSRGETPAVAVVDRFGQLYDLVEAGSDHDFPGHERLLGILLGIAVGCPECGVPDVPGPATMPEPGTLCGGMRLGV